MDYSQAATLMSCAKKHDWIKNHGLKSEDTNATSFGSAWHKIMEAHASGEYVNVPAVLSSIEWQDPFDDYRTGAKLAAGYDLWRQRWQDETWQVMSTEKKMSVPIVPYCEPLSFILDAVVLTKDPYTEKEGKWVVDYKTTSRLESDWVCKYRVSNQFKWYLLGARGVPLFGTIEGVIVDVYHATKGVKSSKDLNEQSGNKFHRLYFKYTEEELNEALKDYVGIVDLRNYYKAQDHWPKNTSACSMYNTTCPFLDLCDQANPELRAKLAEAMK